MLHPILARGPFRHVMSLPRRRHRLHVMPTSAGLEHAEGPDYRWDGRRRGTMPFAVVQHTVAGEGRLVYDNAPHRVRTGETMLVTVPHRHCYWLEAGERWEFFWIAICGQEALRLLHAILAATGPVIRLRPEAVEQLAGACLDLSNLPGEAVGRASSIGYAAVMTLYDDVLGRPDPQQSGRSHSAIARVVAHIRANLDAALDVDALAGIAGCSRAHFTRLFASVEGLSPAEFVTAQRMSRAAALLGTPGLQVKAIARACGYRDSNYFAKAFRASYGVSPTEFRSTGMYGGSGGRRPAAR